MTQYPVKTVVTIKKQAEEQTTVNAKRITLAIGNEVVDMGRDLIRSEKRNPAFNSTST